jgi:hypothetical protein
MAKQRGTSAGTGATRLWIAIGLVVVALALPAIAWALSAQTIDIGGDVFSDKCAPCHSNYSETNKHPKYVFSHGNHITYQCSSCHPEFPHKPDGTVKPVMKDCWNCHGLQHGPQGVLASGTCTDCHGDKLVDLRPANHTFDWAKKPHVAPANESLTTLCSMCHTKADCDECHVKLGIAWSPTEPMVYDAGNGCMACHGSPNLIKSSAAGVVSFQVTGIEASAHREVTCPECHIDFAYAKVSTPSKVWYVNAGLCGNGACHNVDDPKTEVDDDMVTPWTSSVHGIAYAKGDTATATCGSCHGNHSIARLDTEAARLDLRLSGEAMCAECHQDYWDNYNDSYHGAAYKRQAEDAPPCWSCHPAHTMLASDDPASTTNVVNLPTTCSGPDGCHEQHVKTSEEFVEYTSALIHKQEGVRSENLLVRIFGFLPGGD